MLQTRIVLIQPSLPENVGAVARSMANFGLTELVLVGGVSPTHPQAVAVSVGFDHLLHEARQVDTLEEALAGAVLVLGTTAREMPGVDRACITPEAGAALARDHAKSGPVALVFGTEKSGMTNDELRRCHQVITIPGEPEACLNLAMAASICMYEWRLAAMHAPPQSPNEARPLTAVAADAGLDDLASRLGDVLMKENILKPRDATSKLHTLRRILSRARLTPDEAAMVDALVKAALYKKP
jgi:TrmH family RNA methyltransferase